MQRICIQVCARVGLLLLSAMPLGCQHYDPVTNSTFVGSGLGATTGAIIGHQSGNTGAGALIGAAAGALGGALVGDAQQARSERDSANAYAQGVSQSSQQYSAGAVTNSDVIYMAQNGLGDDVIINSINTRGGRFDTSPISLIQLKSAGVSDRVISAVQSSGPAIAPVNYVVPPPPPRPSVIFVEPPPPRPIFFGSYGRHRHHCRPPHRESGLFIHGHF
jgi:uncharacterized protein YcfJ